jgi:hypothetical protein
VGWVVRRTLLFFGALLVLASPARAQYDPQFDLRWTDCDLGPLAAFDVENPCTSNSGSYTLVASFVPPFPIPAYAGNLCVIEVRSGVQLLSPWWRLQDAATAGCPARAGKIVASANFTIPPFSFGACADALGPAAATSLVYEQEVNPPTGALIKAGASVPPGSEVPIDNSKEWYAVAISILKDGTIPTTDCPGCSDGACIQILELHLFQAPPAPEIVLTDGPQSWVSYNGRSGSVPAPCPYVPVRNRTWGEIKSLYR